MNARSFASQAPRAADLAAELFLDERCKEGPSLRAARSHVRTLLNARLSPGQVENEVRPGSKRPKLRYAPLGAGR